MGLASFNRMRREQATNESKVSDVPLDIGKLNIKELRVELDNRGISYEANATKAVLLDLLDQAANGDQNGTNDTE